MKDETPAVAKKPRPKSRKPVPDIPRADLTHVDTETDRTIVVALRIPFFGKRAKAIEFITETLPRVIAVGIGSNVEIGDAFIDNVPVSNVEVKPYDMTPGVQRDAADRDA